MPATLDISVDASGLEDGTYNGQIVIASAELDNSPQTVDVTLIVGSGSQMETIYLPVVLQFSGASSQHASQPTR